MQPHENVESINEPEIESVHSAHDWGGDDERDLRKEIIESQRTRSHTSREPLPDDVVYDDDYTESTASIGSGSISASIESIEQFINSVRSATNTTNSNTAAANTRQPVNDELETYHPRMEMRALSPYRTPEPGQATVILNKPVPLPDPDIMPKSILKRRTSNENNVNESTTTTTSTVTANEEKALPPFVLPSSQPQTQPSPLPPPTQKQMQPKSNEETKAQPHLQPNMEEITKPIAPKRGKEKRSFLNLFSKKTTSTENLKNRPPEPVDGNEEKKPEKVADKEKKKLKTRQESFEENKVEQVAVIDHYSDIVREMGSRDSSRPPSRQSSYMPLYMNNQAVRDAAAKADEEEREYARQRSEQSQFASNEQIAKSNFNQDEDAQFMLEVAKKMHLYTESNEYESKASAEQSELVAEASAPLPLSQQHQQGDLVEISVEHTKSVSYSVRQIKKPDTVAPHSAIGTVYQANAKSLTESTKQKNDCDGNNSVIDTKKHDTLVKVKCTAHPVDRKSNADQQQQRSESNSPISSERKTSLSQTVLKVTRMPIEFTNNDIDIDLPQSESPSPEPRCKTPEQTEIDADVETNSISTLSFTINMIMFVMACWLYIFYDARYAVPFLAVMVGRYARDIIVNKWHKWTKRKSD